MTWEDLEDKLHREIDKIDRLLTQPEELKGVHESYEFSISWEKANWTLRHERAHQEAVDGAFVQRVKSGDWPTNLNKMQLSLVRLRLFAMLYHIDILEAWGALEVETLETALERVAVQLWPKLRYMEHLRSAVDLPVSSVDDPFEPGTPPVWLE